MNVASKTREILDRSFDEPISVEDGNYLMNLKGSDIYALLATADAVRHEIVGDTVTFINNCNINFTIWNCCYKIKIIVCYKYSDFFFQNNSSYS